MLSRRGVLLLGGALGLATLARAEAGTRVLVLGGDLAEIVFALGAGGKVIAADDTSLWPAEAAALRRSATCGGCRRSGSCR